MELKPSNCFMQKSRLFMSHAMGAFSPNMYGRIQLLDNTPDLDERIKVWVGLRACVRACVACMKMGGVDGVAKG